MIRRGSWGASLLGAVTGVLCSVAVSSAQGAAPPALPRGRLVLSLGAAWVGADHLGSRTASTRQAAIATPTPPPFALFETTSTLGGAAAVDLGVLVPITPAWAIEVRGSAGRPVLSTTVSRDVEASGEATASETVSEYVVDASVMYHAARPRLGRRAQPYVLAGGGYLRQLHEDRVAVETGATAHAGGGVRVWLHGGPGRGREVGLTSEVRWVWRMDGISVNRDVRALPAASLRLFMRL